ncbi:pentatricopeptide repeat-containing protein At4g21170 [Humulus lupulus]|uniref:pentatricopeptide repeat-containing protein At4g21170 n=1 Tax=Humulus lupulus TaxID=3486 RepID=UPI002B41595C|nr:pentatricopeptide repeat-containing protein At4g21170 [Humulus lupulus]XP_062089213.1 pentatricopeptide repeat-containing protein At4g21170 [Humulus lupulus]
MLKEKAHRVSQQLSLSSAASQRWRTEVQRNQLASKISSILLQRHNWVQLLQNLKLTPPLFLQILHRIQNNPRISLDFFHWAKSHLGFESDLKSQCHVIQISLGSGFTQSVKPLLDSLVQSYPAPVLVEHLTLSCKGKNSLFLSLSFVLETYGRKGLFREGLEVYGKMRVHGYTPSISVCNVLLDAIQRGNEIRLAWSFYGAILRNGVLPNKFTWSLIARIIGRNGEHERIARIIELGVYSSEIYNSLLDCLTKSGNFKASFDCLNEMHERKLNPGFSTLSLILNGACKYENSEAIARIMSIMVENELISMSPLCEYDTVIQKLCGLNRTYAAEMFFRKAFDENIGLQDATYGYMLRVLSKEERTDIAIWIYSLISEKGVVLNEATYNAFASVLLRKEQSEEVCELLMELIKRGFSPCSSDLSGFLAVLCRKGRWREAEDMLNVILDKGLLPDSLSCCSLVEHYCFSKQIESAIKLHDKMEKMNLSLDVTTYNVLLNGLVVVRRMEEAVRVFDHMRSHQKLSSASFTVMIQGLSRLNELRKALKLHDEMLKMGLKPEEATYKSLIFVFK